MMCNVTVTITEKKKNCYLMDWHNLSSVTMAFVNECKWLPVCLRVCVLACVLACVRACAGTSGGSSEVLKWGNSEVQEVSNEMAEERVCPFCFDDSVWKAHEVTLLVSRLEVIVSYVGLSPITSYFMFHAVRPRTARPSKFLDMYSRGFIGCFAFSV